MCLLAELVLKYFTKDSEVLSHFSTLAKDNPYIHVSHGRSMRDGFQRARLLRDLKIKLGDSKGYEQIGHVVISSVEGADHEIRHISLQKGRFYDYALVSQV